MEAGNFIATGIKRFYQGIPLFEFPSVTIPGWIPGFGGKKIGGFEVVNPLFFTPIAAMQQMEAMKKLSSSKINLYDTGKDAYFT